MQEYLSGLGSLRDICKKYKISSTRTLRQWIALYKR
ncbi:helix-turn-helix domain-containing protein [Blautia sp.]